MGTVIPAWFLGEMRRLSGLRFAPTDLAMHWDGLADIDQGGLARAVTQAIRECETFPSPALLRILTARTAPPVGPDEDRSTPLDTPHVIATSTVLGRDLPVVREWKFYCETCRDSGWVSSHCFGVHACGRDFPHAAHEVVTRCECWTTNPAVVKRRERAAQQAAMRGGGRGAAA